MISNLAKLDTADVRLSGSDRLGYFFLTELAPHLDCPSDLIVGEFPIPAPPSDSHVSHVVSLSSSDKMVRIDARRIVAGVPDNETAVEFSEMHLVNGSVCIDDTLSVPELPMANGLPSTCPFPALIFSKPRRRKLAYSISNGFAPLSTFWELV